MILSRTPLRITLAGGGTDLPSFYSKHAGLVVSMAINKYIYLTYKPDYFEKLLKLRYSKIEIVRDAINLENHRARAALLSHGIRNCCEINSCADLPSNTGLGSSGSFLVGLLNCIREYKRINTEPSILAEEACKIEIETLQEPVGKQDQYIAAFGGTKILHIDNFGKVIVDNLNLNDEMINEFISHLQVYYLNIKRDASDILAEQQKLKTNTEDLLQLIKEDAIGSILDLESGNFDSYGKRLDAYWELKKKLSNKITVPVVEDLYGYVKKEFGISGGKIIGAGGGGFLLLYSPDKNKNVEDYMLQKGFSRLSFNVDKRGSTILGNYIN